MGYGYRPFLWKGVNPTATNPSGDTIALAEMDPDYLNVAGGHRNVWVEAPYNQHSEWEFYFGPCVLVDTPNKQAQWRARSDKDPNRISSFPPEATATGGITPAQIQQIIDGVLAGLPSEGGGSPTDLQPVLDAIAALSVKMDSYPKPPTAAENGAAARAAIVKED